MLKFQAAPWKKNQRDKKEKTLYRPVDYNLYTKSMAFALIISLSLLFILGIPAADTYSRLVYLTVIGLFFYCFVIGGIDQYSKLPVLLLLLNAMALMFVFMIYWIASMALNSPGIVPDLQGLAKVYAVTAIAETIGHAYTIAT